MNINLTTKGRRIEKIAVGDVLIFDNRQESVIDITSGGIHTERQIDEGETIKIEIVSYEGIEKLTKDSEGEVHGYRRTQKNG